jgi:ferredoxin-NADP reductase
MQAVIIKKEIIALNTLYLKLKINDAGFSFVPGQHFTLSLPELKYPDERGTKRIFSIIWEPEPQTLSLATRISQSGYKRTLVDLSLGSILEIDDIKGDFLTSFPTKQVVFIAGGIGITPFLSALRANESEHDFTLVYSNKNKEEAAFLNELQQAPIKLFTNFSEEEGRVDKKFLEKCLIDFSATFYIAGPPGFVAAMRSILDDIGVESERIISEDFFGY